MADVVLDDIDGVIREIGQSLKRIEGRGDSLPRRGSRFADQGADPSVVKTIAAGGSIVPTEGVRAGDRRSAGGIGLLMAKAMAEATPTAGGYLVPEEISGEILRQLRARSVVYGMGPRVVPVKKQLSVTAISSGATAYYVQENAQIPVSEMTFAQAILLQPKMLAGLIPCSNRLLKDAAENPSVEAAIRADIAEVLSLLADLAFLTGTGLNGEPHGITNALGTTPAPALDGDVTFDWLKDVVALLRNANARFSLPGWIIPVSLISLLEKVKTTTGGYLADAGLLTFDPTGAGGTLLGFRFATTTQMPDKLIFCSDWSDAVWIGEQQELVIEVSSEASYWDTAASAWVSSYQNDQSVFRAKFTHDIGVRRPQLVVVAALSA